MPVVNRGQRDIDSGKAIHAALENERKFFENHASYAGKSQYCGTPFLARKLNMVNIRYLPKIEFVLNVYLTDLDASRMVTSTKIITVH